MRALQNYPWSLTHCTIAAPASLLIAALLQSFTPPLTTPTTTTTTFTFLPSSPTINSTRRALSRIGRKGDNGSGTESHGPSTNHSRKSSSNNGASSPVSLRRSLVNFLRERDYTSSSDKLSDESSAPLSKNQQKRIARQQRRQVKSRLSEEQRNDSEQRRLDKEEENYRAETPEVRARYGELPPV